MVELPEDVHLEIAEGRYDFQVSQPEEHVLRFERTFQINTLEVRADRCTELQELLRKAVDADGAVVLLAFSEDS